jgi:hypothetical protein
VHPILPIWSFFLSLSPSAQPLTHQMVSAKYKQVHDSTRKARLFILIIFSKLDSMGLDNIPTSVCIYIIYTNLFSPFMCTQLYCNISKSIRISKSNSGNPSSSRSFAFALCYSSRRWNFMRAAATGSSWFIKALPMAAASCVLLLTPHSRS